MRSALISTARPILTAVCLCVVLVRFAPAAPPPHLAPEDLTASVRFEEDRAAAQEIAAARDAIRRGDHSRAVILLQEVFDSGRVGLVATKDGYRSPQHYARQLLRDAPRGLLEHYRRHSAAVAVAELNAAIDGGDEQDLLRVALKFRFTEAGGRALDILAQRRFDGGRFPDAATLFEELIRGSPDPDQEARNRPAAVVAWIRSLHHAGNALAALEVFREFASEFDAAHRAMLPVGLLEDPEPSAEDHREQRDIIGWLPSGRAIWEFPFPTEDVIPGDVDEMLLQEFAAAGISPILQAHPLSVGEGLIIRTVHGVIRLNAHSGVLEWRWPSLPEDPVELPGDPAEFPNAGLYASLDSPRLLERAVGDSVHARLAADRERVFFLEDPNADSAPAASNSLIAVDVGTGDALWGLGTQRGRERDLHGVFFRGAPTVHGDELLIVGDRDTTTELFSLDASSGVVNWSVTLCQLPASPVRDDRRLAQECRVHIAAGNAVCPTGGGGLVAVNLLSRTVSWACRYPREPLYEDDNASHSQAQTVRQLVWADSWRAPHLSISGERIILASAESDVLHVLSARSGAVLWTRPRGRAVAVACVTDTHVILVEPDHVSAVALEDGKVAWSVAAGQPAGRGCVVHGHYLLPLLGGGAAAIRLTDGRLTQTHSASDMRPRIALDADTATAAYWRPVSLERVGDHVVQQSLDGVSRMMNLADALNGSSEAPTGDTRTVELVIHHAAHLREAGRFDAATELLLSQIDTAADDSQREHLRQLAFDAMLTAIWLSNDDARLGAAEELIETAADRIRFEFCRLRGAMRDPSSDSIINLLTLLDLGAERYFVEREGATGWVRLDRQAQAWLLQVLREVEEPARELLEETLADALTERGALSGGTGSHRMLSLLDHIGVARELRVQLPPRWSTMREFIVHEFELEALARQTDGVLAADALAALTDMYEAHSDYRMAAQTLLRLQDLAAEHSSSEMLPEIAEDSPLQPYLEDPALPDWPSRQPEVTSKPGVNDDPVYYAHPETVCEAPPLIDGLTVSVDRSGNRLTFSGASWNQQWQLDLPPPPIGSGDLMRGNLGYADLRRAWAFGNLLVLQVGGNVFGIAPLDRNGEPSAQLVWPPASDLISAGKRPARIFVNPQSDVPRAHGFVERRLLLDRRWQPVGRVGPVRRGYFCVRHGGELTAFQTATGARLWTRSSLPPAAQCHGDDEHLVLIRPDTAEVLLLRALDGAVISSFEWALHDAELLGIFECRALVINATGDGLHLVLSDLTTGEPVWSRPIDADAVCFPIDDFRFGLLEPDGVVRMITLDSGEDFAVEQVQRPDRLTGVRTLLDQHTLFLLLTQPVDDPEIQATIRTDGNSPNTGFRRFEVNGGMYAFDRQTGDLNWGREMDNAVALLDQPGDVPVLVFKELRIEGPGSSNLQNRTRVIDKRTGETLMDERTGTPFIRYIVKRSLEEAWVEIQCPDRIYRLDYLEREEGEESP